MFHIRHFADSLPSSRAPCTMLCRKMLATSMAWLICKPVSTPTRRFWSKFRRASWRAAIITRASSIAKILVLIVNRTILLQMAIRQPTSKCDPGRAQDLPEGAQSRNTWSRHVDVSKESPKSSSGLLSTESEAIESKMQCRSFLKHNGIIRLVIGGRRPGAEKKDRQKPNCSSHNRSKPPPIALSLQWLLCRLSTFPSPLCLRAGVRTRTSSLLAPSLPLFSATLSPWARTSSPTLAEYVFPMKPLSTDASSDEYPF